MLNGPTALAMTLAPLAETLRDDGVDFDALARRAGVDPALLARHNARYPSARVHRLWRLAAEAASSDPLLGQRVGGPVRPGTFHALGLGIVSSTSLLAALKRIERYSNVISTNGRFVLVEREGNISLETRPHERTVLPDPHWIDAMVVGLVRLLEMCAGPTARPMLVRVPPRSAASPEALGAALGCPVVSDSDHVAIVFGAARVAEPLVSGNAELAAEADRIAARCMEQLAPESTAARVGALILKALSSGEVDQDRIARAEPEPEYAAASPAGRRHQLPAPARRDAARTRPPLPQGRASQPRRDHVSARLRGPEQFHARLPPLDRRDATAVPVLTARPAVAEPPPVPC